MYRFDCFQSYVTRALSEGVLTCIFRSVTSQPDTAGQLGLEVLKPPSVFTPEGIKNGPPGVLLGTPCGGVPSGSSKSLPYFKPKNVIFRTRFQTWPLGRNYVTIT